MVPDPPAEVRQLVDEYRAFQRLVPLKSAEPKLFDLVRFNGNKNTPIHGWYSFKEGFSAHLLPWLCSELKYKVDELEYLLDPFCGVGTSLLSAQLSYQGKGNLHAYGIEYNPFIRSVAQAKLAWPNYRPDLIARYIPTFLNHNLPGSSRVSYPVPPLSTIKNPKAFSPEVVQELLHFRQRIQTDLENEPEKDFFLLGWATIIEKVSGVRKDGRALRFEEKNGVPTVTAALRAQWASMLADLRLLTLDRTVSQNVKIKIFSGDARTIDDPEILKNKFDLILYSPPYLNNIDYSEVYKLELWLSGFVSTKEEFKSLRLGTLRSHPSVKFPESSAVDKLSPNSAPRRLRDALVKALPENEDTNWRIRLVRGYMDDMYQALSTQFRLARPGAHVVCVVGNSLHGRKDHPIPIVTDLLICALAREVGFEIERLQVARLLGRRDLNNKLMRESIIIMRRPRT